MEVCYTVAQAASVIVPARSLRGFPRIFRYEIVQERFSCTTHTERSQAAIQPLAQSSVS